MEARQLLNEYNKIQKPIQRAINHNYYNDLGSLEFIEQDTMDTLKIKVIPQYGFHKHEEYFITLHIRSDEWPLVFIDSVLFDKVKTNQYLKNKGKVGSHKGICIKNLSYAYGFTKNFKEICNNQWENYLFQIITLFNNFQNDFQKGCGIKSNFQELLSSDEWIDL